MTASWIEDRRRKRAREMAGDLNAGMDAVIGGLGGIDDEQKAQAKLARDTASDTASDARAAETQKDNLATNALRRKADQAQHDDGAAKAKADSEWKVLRAKGESDEQSRKVLIQKRADAKAEARAGMQRGLSRAELERLAGEAGTTPDALLLDADNDETVERSTASEGVLKRRKVESEIDENKAQAKKALTPKAGPRAKTPEEIERQKKKDEETDLDIAIKKRALGDKEKPPPSDQQRGRKDKIAALERDVNALDAAIVKVEASGMDPGLLSGPMRSIWADVAGDEDQSDFEASAAAVNSQVFGLLRTDAPSESETKMIGRLQVKANDNPVTIKSKLKTIRALIAARAADPDAALDQLGVAMPGGSAPAAAKAPAEMTDEEIAAELGG